MFAPTNYFFQFAAAIKRASLSAATFTPSELNLSVSSALTKSKSSLQSRFHLLSPKSEIKSAVVSEAFYFFGGQRIF